MEHVKAKVYEIIKRTFNLQEDLLDENCLKEGSISGWDSLGHLKLLMEIEREFSIKFSVDDVEKSRTFRDIVSLVEVKLNEKKS